MKKILTIILDGFGMREDIYGNAIKNAGMNNFINIWNKYPHCLLKSSGKAIGLPDGQCGDSSLGHKILGAGRNVGNRLSVVNDELKKDKVKNNIKYKEMLNLLNNNKKNLHICSLLSDGGVSSHIEHLKFFLNNLHENHPNITIYLHLISDGRDSNKYSVLKYLNEITPFIKDNIHLASLCGRYYALDNTEDFSRTEMYYDLLVNEKGVDSSDLSRIINKCYEKKISDEYLPPLKMIEYTSVKNEDVLLLLNFSKSNQKQLLDCLIKKDFEHFITHKELNINVYSLYEIDEKLNDNYFFEDEEIKHNLCYYLAELGLSQARITESIKKEEMTYFLDGCSDKQLNNCDLYIVDSPKVDSFDMKPEMNALTIAKTIIKCMEKDYDFIIANFANPDEIGHTGNYHATINGLQAVDVCLGKILEVAEENFYKVIVTSGHAKADTIIDKDNNIVTKNTTSPVPFVILDKKLKLKNGNISMIAPTILKYMDIALPKEMKETEMLFEE